MTAPAHAQPERGWETAAPQPAPVLEIVRGNPSAEQVAALVAVLAMRGARSADAAHASGGRSEWSSRSRLMRAPLTRGTGGWRASALPR
jgi:hypothetical protein